MKKVAAGIGKFALELIGGFIAYLLMLCLLMILSFVAMLTMALPFYIDGAITALLYGGNLIQIANASIMVNTLALAIAIGTTTSERQSFSWGLQPDWILVGINIAYYSLLALVVYRNQDRISRAKSWLSSRFIRDEQTPR